MLQILWPRRAARPSRQDAGPINRFGLRTAISIAVVLLATACAGSGTSVGGNEDMLAAAGFVPKRGDSPARIAAIKSLPPHRFVMRTTDGKPKYLYADPTVCGCIYVGDQQAYDQYRQNMAARQTTTDEQIRAVLSTAPLPGESGL